MGLFTVEVQGRPVLVFAEEDRAAAEELVSSIIGPDLADFEENGQPVWDGEDELSVRNADAGESAQWEEGFAEAVRNDGAGEADRAGYAVFLIEVDAPLDRDEDEEEEED